MLWKLKSEIVCCSEKSSFLLFLKKRKTNSVHEVSVNTVSFTVYENNILALFFF